MDCRGLGGPKGAELAQQIAMGSSQLRPSHPPESFASLRDLTMAMGGAWPVGSGPRPYTALRGGHCDCGGPDFSHIWRPLPRGPRAIIFHFGLWLWGLEPCLLVRDTQLRCLSPGDSILTFVPQILLASSASIAWGKHNVHSLHVSGASRGRGRGGIHQDEGWDGGYFIGGGLGESQHLRSNCCHPHFTGGETG